MSPLFTYQERAKLKAQMLDVGISLVKEHGMTHTSVEKVTKAVGLGKGTFYQYFTTKEMFIYEIIEYQREQLKQEFEQLLNGRDKIPACEAREYFKRFMSREKSVLAHLTVNDIKKLRANLPKECFFDPDQDMIVIKTFFSHIDGIQAGIDYKVVANLVKITGLALESKDLLHEEAFDMTLDMINHLTADYIFGGND